jgi:peptidoglycan/xylan/chitin deacetylase (PgdA/CDA1 family)
MYAKSEAHGPDNYKPPACFCPTPNGMERSTIPQIVMFTFDDAMTGQVYDFYKKLFPIDRLNPNGCPVSVTFFLSHNYTDYNLVKQMYQQGHEMASHSITHRTPTTWWAQATYDQLLAEFNGQRDNIAQKAAIPKSEVRGLRVPFLEIGGDNQFKMMTDIGFEYDSTFTIPKDKDGGIWPFTLDSVDSYPKFCKRADKNCPTKKWEGIWEIPLNVWEFRNGRQCAMVDSCRPADKEEALAYLWQNFNHHYNRNRSPFGVNMHASWFFYPHNFEAMKEFVADLVDMDDVYIVTAHQALQWMKDPHTIEEVKIWQPWLRSCYIAASIDVFKDL